MKMKVSWSSLVVSVFVYCSWWSQRSLKFPRNHGVWLILNPQTTLIVCEYPFLCLFPFSSDGLLFIMPLHRTVLKGDETVTKQIIDTHYNVDLQEDLRIIIYECWCNERLKRELNKRLITRECRCDERLKTCCFLWIEKVRTKYKTYEWGSVRWETKH
jgi:hypothetical protein